LGYRTWELRGFNHLFSALIGFGHSRASAQVINGCIKGNGTLKMVADQSDCTSRETPISWLGE
jgi:hypothetical protein